MGDGTRDTRAGISYGDVAQLMRRVGKAHGGRVRLTLDVPVRSDHGVVLDVRASLWRRLGTGPDSTDVRGTSARWPSGQSSTFAGLLFRLVYELDASLDEEEAAAERAAAGQPRLF